MSLPKLGFKMEKKQGPARSPIVLLTCRPLSAKAEAHWLMACSDAPAQTISKARIQKIFCLNKPEMDIPSPSDTMGAMGTRRNNNALNAGIRAHRQPTSRQLSIPNAENSTVDSSTTATVPQQ